MRCACDYFAATRVLYFMPRARLRQPPPLPVLGALIAPRLRCRQDGALMRVAASQRATPSRGAACRRRRARDAAAASHATPARQRDAACAKARFSRWLLFLYRRCRCAPQICSGGRHFATRHDVSCRCAMLRIAAQAARGLMPRGAYDARSYSRRRCLFLRRRFTSACAFVRQATPDARWLR